MIQQRSPVMQSYYDSQQKRRRERPVAVRAKLHFDGKSMAFRVPARKSKWGQLVDIVFRRRP